MSRRHPHIPWDALKNTARSPEYDTVHTRSIIIVARHRETSRSPREGDGAYSTAQRRGGHCCQAPRGMAFWKRSQTELSAAPSTVVAGTADPEPGVCAQLRSRCSARRVRIQPIRDALDEVRLLARDGLALALEEVLRDMKGRERLRDQNARCDMRPRLNALPSAARCSHGQHPSEPA